MTGPPEATVIRLTLEETLCRLATMVRSEAPRLTQQGLKILAVFLAEPRTRLAGADIMRRTGLSSGSLYPLLMRFEDAGLLRSAWEEGDPRQLGRPRKRLYTLTAHGAVVARAALAELHPSWSGLLVPNLG
jgi:PadR family transcriptional regulator PadR